MLENFKICKACSGNDKTFEVTERWDMLRLGIEGKTGQGFEGNTGVSII